MPRPSKPIHPDRSLDAPASPSRQHVWSKYGEQMASELPPAPEVAVEVDDITVVERPEAALTVVPEVEERSTPEPAPAPEPVPERIKKWQVVRSIHGRTYRRVDTATFVDAPDDSTDSADQAFGSPHTSSS